MNKSFLLLVAVFLLLMTRAALADEFTKKYEKTYDVNRESQLIIDNRYGDITINTWEQQQVQIMVTITAESKKEDKAQRFFETVNIEFTNSPEMVKAVTSFSSKKQNIKEFSIDYVIYAPGSLAYDLKNKFGNIYLPDLGGSLFLNLSYGEFDFGRLLNENNTLKISFSEGDIEAMTGGTITMSYSELSAEKLMDVQLNTSFSELDLESVEAVDIYSKYDEYKLGLADVVKLDCSFTEFTISMLNMAFTGDLDYGELVIKHTGIDMNDIYINSKFTDVFCGLTNSISWDFNAITEYSDIDFGEAHPFVSQIEKNSYKKNYSGVLWEKNKANSASFTLEMKNSDATLRMTNN